MYLEIGKIYRDSSKNMDYNIEFVDGLPNYYYYTHVDGVDQSFKFQRGIHPVSSIIDKDGMERIPFLIISSSPHKAGSEYTPWKDNYDPNNGFVKYFGDNKTNENKPEDSPGNKILLNLFKTYQSSDKKTRIEKAVPIIFFERVTYEGRKLGNLKFNGFGILENVKLVTQSNNSGYEFANYLYDFCIFSLTDENEKFDWKWLADRCNPNLNNEETNRYAPKSWKKWLKDGNKNIEKSRRNVAKNNLVKKEEQIPKNNSRQEKILSKIMNYFESKKHKFELLALECVKFYLEESGAKYKVGWITKKSGDRGVDFVTSITMGEGLSKIELIILGQAKCENSATSGKDIARTVARLKRGWIGAYVTTSYFSEPVQEEIIEDKYPLILINGLRVAELIDRHVLMGIGGKEALIEYLESLDDKYENVMSNKAPESILDI